MSKAKRNRDLVVWIVEPSTPGLLRLVEVCEAQVLRAKRDARRALRAGKAGGR